MFGLSNRNTPVSVLQRDWGAKSAALPSWKMLDGHLSQQLEQQLWHPGSLAQGACVAEEQGWGHHALCRCADRWAPLQCFPPLALLAKRAKKGSGGENGDLPIGHVCRRGQCPAPCAPGRTLGAHELLKLPGEKESTQSCPQPSKLGQG